MDRAPAFEPPGAGDARRLGRLARCLLTLCCVSTLTSACTAGAAAGPTTAPLPAGSTSPSGSAAPTGPSSPTATATSRFEPLTEPPPVRLRAVAGGADQVVATRGRHRLPTRPRLPAPAPQQPPHRPAALCDLGERYGGWAVGSPADATCRTVYG